MAGRDWFYNPQQVMPVKGEQVALKPQPLGNMVTEIVVSLSGIDVIPLQWKQHTIAIELECPM